MLNFFAKTIDKQFRIKGVLRFEKGKSGNPSGRPKKGSAFADILEKELKTYSVDLNINGAMKTVRGKELLARSLLNICFDKNSSLQVRLKAIDMVLDRTDGKATQQIDMVADVQTQKGLGIDISKLTAEEKAQMEKMLDKVCNNE